MADRIGQQLDNYRLLRLLGAGGFGEVYLAEHIHRTAQPRIALKILPQLSQDDLGSFLTEARTFRLKHPNIVQVLDFGVEGRTPFIVMEYAPNGTLRQRHPKGTRVPLATIVSYLKQVASALQYAHEERLVHRDIKPENMLIGSENHILLSDFGIATIAHGTSSQSVEPMAGTIPYMAPEQIQGHPRPASDQYSLGVVVYEWLCGERPFQGTLTEMAVQHVMMSPPPLHERVPHILPTVEQIVLQALAKKPEERHLNLTTFAKALEQAVRFSQQPIQVLPPPQPQSGSVHQQPGLPAEPPQVVIQQPSLTQQFREEHSLHTPRNDLSRNSILQSVSFEQLWREAVQVQARGENERAFRLLRRIATLQGLSPSQLEAVKKQIRSLRQMIPRCLQQASEAVYQGRWQDEIQAWEDLLALEPSVQEVHEQLTLHPKVSEWTQWGFPMEEDIQERLHLARQNEQCAWMYTQAQQFIREQDTTSARIQLEMLWNNAPTFGDPAGLAQVVGLPPTSNYEQALIKEQARQQEEQARQQQEMEKAERERQGQEATRRKKQKEGEIILGAAAGALAGAAAGALLVILVTSGIVVEAAITFPLVSAIERFLAAITLRAGLTEILWGAILGALGGLITGAVLANSLAGDGDNEEGTTAAGLVGAIAGLPLGGLFGASYPGGGAWIWGIVFVILVSLGGLGLGRGIALMFKDMFD